MPELEDVWGSAQGIAAGFGEAAMEDLREIYRLGKRIVGVRAEDMPGIYRDVVGHLRYQPGRLPAGPTDVGPAVRRDIERVKESAKESATRFAALPSEQQSRLIGGALWGGATGLVGGPEKAAAREVLAPTLEKAAKWAKEYPKPGRPVVKEKEKGGTFLARRATRESEQLMKARERARKKIAKGEYTPYFDVKARRDVDPKKYPLRADTLKEGLPARRETIARLRREIQTDGARARLQAAYDNGLRTGFHDAWYKMGQLEDEFVKEYGEKQGRLLFRERFAEAMATTTAGATPESNLLMTAYGNFMRQKGLRVPERAAKVPVPLGGLKLGKNMEIYNKVINEAIGLSEGAPKRHNFAGNFMGHTDPATIDEVMTNIITPGKGAPGKNQYFAYEELIHEMALRNGIDPREFQAIAWGGDKARRTGGKYVAKPMIQVVNEAIARTSMVTGMSPREVVRKSIVRAEAPLYGVAAGVGAGAAAGGARGAPGNGGS